MSSIRVLSLLLAAVLALVGIGLSIGNTNDSYLVLQSTLFPLHVSRGCGVIMIGFKRGERQPKSWVITEITLREAMYVCKTSTDADHIPPWWFPFRLLSHPNTRPVVVFRPWLLTALGASILGYLFVCKPWVIRRRRKQKGLCIHCAYDLTGNQSGVCPECGTRTAPPDQSPGTPPPPS